MLSSCFISIIVCHAQSVYTIDASQAQTTVSSNFVMGNPGRAGKEIKANNRFITIGGKAVIPVMGEMHFARVPKANWEDVILKMKANGINIIASYIFWIHHEEIEGKYDWSGNKDLKAFAELCKKHGMFFYPRIGPWCHGEARNGGTPDWLLLKKDIRVRSNDSQYQKYVDLWFAQIGAQLKGLIYKDDGPVIGVQLENEYVRGKGGEQHILWLKKIAVKYGLDVPLYTVTGWGNASVPENEVLPLFGAYPDEPWMNDLEKNTSCNNFAFSPVRNDANIGNELSQAVQQQNATYPYFTCEMGVGIDNTAHRRLFIHGIDGNTLVTAKLGSGSNLMGYYMFAGGFNPQGILTSMEENAIESGGYNTNPAVAYDFQAAIGKTGELAPSYYEVKKTHYFLNEFGNLLAPMEPVFISTGSELKLSARVKDNQAFLFGINYCRNNVRKKVSEAQFVVKLKDETITFPSQPADIPDSTVFMWPLNFRIGNVLLKYATVQPLCKINAKDADQFVFIQNMNNKAEFCFDSEGIQKLTRSSGTVVKKDGKYIVSGITPGYTPAITIFPKNGLRQNIILLSQADAKHAWLLNNEGRKHFFISNTNLYLKDGRLHAFGSQDVVTIKSLTDEKLVPTNKLKLNVKREGLFTITSYRHVTDTFTVSFHPEEALQNARWLMVNKLGKLNKKQVLNHHFVYKEFDFKKQAAVRSAKLVLYTMSDCRIQLNDVMVNCEPLKSRLNEIDVTGYIKAGNNRLLLEFPFEEGEKLAAARLIVEYLNNDLAEIATDSSWLAKDAYTFPSLLTGGYPTSQAELSGKPVELNVTFRNYQEYTLKVPELAKSMSKSYLHVYYTGDKSRLYNNGQLIDDNFNNHTYWSIGLNSYSDRQLSKGFKIQVYTLKKDARVYFDLPSEIGDDQKPEIKSIQVIPEYEAVFKL